MQIDGQVIKAERERQKRSQAEVAWHAGVSRETLGRAERGEHKTTLENLSRITATLRIPLQSVLKVESETVA